MAPEPNFEMSKEGIKIPYRRFLSDSAPGFILILIGLYAYYTKSTIFGIVIAQVIPPSISSEVKIFLLLAAFFLATPIGLTINVISWILLEFLQKLIEILFLTVNRLLYAFKEEYFFFEAVAQFGLNKKNWFRKVRAIETALVENYPKYGESIEPLRGTTILLRNIGFIGLFVSIDALLPDFNIAQIIFGVTIFIIFLFSSAITSFYFHVQILFWSIFHSRNSHCDFFNEIRHELSGFELHPQQGTYE